VQRLALALSGSLGVTQSDPARGASAAARFASASTKAKIAFAARTFAF
jgi:hypothetical protein